jgi:hypothetical protein
MEFIMTKDTEKLNKEIARVQTWIAQLETTIKQERVYLAKLMFDDCRHTLQEEANDNNQ